MTIFRRRHDVAPLDMDEPAGYVGWSAEAKGIWLWNTLIGGTAHTPTALPPLTLPFRTAPLTEARIVLSPRELDKALTRESDLMEPGRPKLIHARGAVAMVRLSPAEGTRFTGLLGPDGAHGLIRLSLVAKVEGDAAYTPALALKLLIDGQCSADVLAMNHTVGQGRDFNLFSNTMTNDLSHTHNELRLAQRVMSYFFHRVSNQPRRMVSTHLATHRTDGSPVVDVVAPERLVFTATPAANAVFEDRAGVDFRLVLRELETDTTLYAVDGITDGRAEPIGTISMTTPFVSSDGGDRLFFRHVHDPAHRVLD